MSGPLFHVLCPVCKWHGLIEVARLEQALWVAADICPVCNKAAKRHDSAPRGAERIGHLTRLTAGDLRRLTRAKFKETL